MIINRKIETALRIVLGVCFILSGAMKAVNVYSFAQEIRLYSEAYMDSFFLPWRVEIAVVICAIETITGLLALKQKCASVVSIVFLCMLSFFVWLTGLNLFSPSLMGSIESCGCFGELVHFSPLEAFLKSVVLWVMAAWLWGLCLRKGWNMRFKDVLMYYKTYVIAIAGLAPAVYSYLFFEKWEHGWYIAGYIGLCVVLLVLLRYCYGSSK